MCCFNFGYGIWICLLQVGEYYLMKHFPIKCLRQLSEPITLFTDLTAPTEILKDFQAECKRSSHGIYWHRVVF